MGEEYFGPPGSKLMRELLPYDNDKLRDSAHGLFGVHEGDRIAAEILSLVRQHALNGQSQQDQSQHDQPQNVGEINGQKTSALRVSPSEVVYGLRLALEFADRRKDEVIAGVEAIVREFNENNGPTYHLGSIPQYLTERVPITNFRGDIVGYGYHYKRVGDVRIG